jgi:hypothetical protein
MLMYLQRVLRRQSIGIVTLFVSAFAAVSVFGITSGESKGSQGTSNELPTPSDDGNPYSAIVRANVFHLTDPPKPVEKPDQILANLPKVNISGFIRHADQPVRALFATVPKDPKEPAKYFNLAEGEKQDILEVLKIADNQESVQVVIAGTPVTLTTKSNSFIQPIVPIKPGVPGAAAVPAVAAARPYTQAPGAPPAAQADNSGGGVIVAGGIVPSHTGASSVTTIGNAGGLSGGTAFNNTAMNNGSGFGAAGIAGSPNSAFQSVPTRGGNTLPNYPPHYQTGSLHEAAALSVIDSQLHADEIQRGEYPPPPPLPQ